MAKADAKPKKRPTRTDPEQFERFIAAARKRSIDESLENFAAKFFQERAAKAGDPDAQARLGYQYAAGLGVGPDYTLAEQWFLASAEQGAASGQYGLGMLYAGAYQGPEDFAKAAVWFEKAVNASGRTPKYLHALAISYVRVGRRDEARKLLDELRRSATQQYVAPDYITSVETSLKSPSP